MDNFTSLVAALEGWFDKPLRDLPVDLQRRITEDFFPMPWHQLSPDQRRSVALQWDAQNDPALEEERRFWWEFFDRRGELEARLATWKETAAPTASDLALKEERIAALERELAQMDERIRQDRGDLEHEGTGANQPLALVRPVSATMIRLHFRISPNLDASDKWWKDVMGDASRYNLTGCRAGGGRRGNSGSLWYPHLIAAWLTDRKKRGKMGLDVKAVRQALTHFPDCLEMMETMFPDDPDV